VAGNHAVATNIGYVGVVASPLDEHEPRCPDMVRSFLCGTRGAFTQELVAIS